MGVTLSTLFAQRQATDYDIFIEINAQEVTEIGTKARAFVEKVKVYFGM